MNKLPDGFKELAEAYAAFVRRARRAPLTRRERERLVDYVNQNAHHIAPAPQPVVPADRDDPWRDIGYGRR